MDNLSANVQGIGRFERALLALAASDTISYDRLCRDASRWPLYLDLCLYVSRLAASTQRDKLLTRLTRPEPSAAVVAPKMERAVALALESHAPAGDVQDEFACDAECAPSEVLLRAAFSEDNPLPRAMADCPRVTLPILLVRWGDTVNECGFVADLTVWAVNRLPRPGVEFHAAPASFLLHADRAFLLGQQRAAGAITQCLEHPEGTAVPALAWDVQPRDMLEGPGSTLGIVGPSASAAFAVAGLALLRERLSPELRAMMHLVEFGRVAVSAGIARDCSSLDPVGGIVHKLGALYRQPLAYGPPPCVFVADAQALGQYATPPQRCSSVRALVEVAAQSTGGQLSESQRILLDAVLHGTTRDVPEQILDRVAATPANSLRALLLSRFARLALPEFGRLHLNFVNLLLTNVSEQLQRAEQDDARRYDSLDALLQANRHVPCFVLTGDPGSGKSTVLRHYELEQARRSILALSRGESDFEVCIWVNLAEYPADLHTVGTKQQALREAAGDPAASRIAQQLVTPIDWLSQRWQRTYPDLPQLSELSRSFKLRLLLDGLNEISAPDSARWRAAVTGLTESLRDAELPMASPILSIRTRESTARLSHPGFAVHQIQLAAWNKVQMRAYCARRLGAAARPLWRQLARDPALLDVCKLPINLAGQCELYGSGLGRAALNRAELFSGLTWSRLRREYMQGRLDIPGLLGDSDLIALNVEGHWVHHVLELPKEGALISGLDRQAEILRRTGRMQIEIEHVAEWIKGPRLREAWISAVRDLGLAATEIGTHRWAYLHQLWLEFFQARGFTHANDLAAAAELTPPGLVDLQDVLAGLHEEEMLPGPGVSPLEETFKLAVQLSSDPAGWIRAASPFNLPLAARAARGCANRIDLATLQALKQSLLHRSRDPAADVRLRIEAASELGELGGDDIRYVARRGPDAAYLTSANSHWIRIPGGLYSIGNDDILEESPLTSVSLDPFEIAFAPVTNQEFSRFVDAGGYEDERWWVGETARLWWRGELRNDERIAFWRPRFEALRRDFDSGVRLYFANVTQGYIDGELRTYAAWSADRAEFELERRFGARKLRLPGLWRNPLYNQPLLPVTGVSLIEAEAYCRWLSAQCGVEHRLPLEAEWEAAARFGTDGRYPWGDIEPEDRWHFNADPAHLRRNSPVGVFPLSDTATGLVDMAGNVEQLTCSEYRPLLDATTLTKRLRDGEALRTSRGGNWSEAVPMCRTTARYWQHPAHRTLRLGFRLIRTVRESVA